MCNSILRTVKTTMTIEKARKELFFLSCFRRPTNFEERRGSGSFFCSNYSGRLPVLFLSNKSEKLLGAFTN